MKCETPTESTGPSGEAKHDFSWLADLKSCPPPDAQPIDGTFYVFHDFDPPSTEADFRTAAQRGQFESLDECARRSNSVWSDLAALKGRVADLKKRYPLRPFYISEGHVKKEHGVVKDSDKSHCSFWVCGRTCMHAIFKRRVV